MRSSAAWIDLSSGTGRRTFSGGTIGALSTSCLAMSSGSSTCVAPGFSASASLNALRMTSGIVVSSRSDVVHLVMGVNISTTFIAWWDSLCSRVVAPCPVIATTGELSMLALATPVTRFDAPGPRVDRHTPG